MELMTSRDAAVLLQTSVRTVARWAKTGRLTPSAKLPGIRGARLFDRRDVEALAGELARGVSA